MRSISGLLVLLFAVMFSSLPMAAGLPSSGVISGSVNYCDQGGVDGMQVYVPGMPYVVITAADGKFQLTGLPAGEYAVHYRLGDRRLNQNRGIRVLAGQTTALSVIAFCDRSATSAGVAASAPSAQAQAQTQTTCVAGSDDAQCKDADGDGVIAALDCDDNNANIFPGAVELCDGVDNNCNGQVDDNVSMTVLHGIGSCADGQVSIMLCSGGFSDCDGDASNGCEINIMNDDDNCGGCGNACASSEMCGLGMC